MGSESGLKGLSGRGDGALEGAGIGSSEQFPATTLPSTTPRAGKAGSAGGAGPSESSGHGLNDRILLLLTNGMTIEAAEGYCMRQAGLDLDAARRTVAQARKKLTVAADYARDEQLGKAVMRLDDLYAKSIAAKDTRTALQAQRELNRLLGLYSPKGPGEDDAQPDAAEALRRLDLIAAYLLPLELTDARYPVEEHARLASEIIRTQSL